MKRLLIVALATLAWCEETLPTAVPSAEELARTLRNPDASVRRAAREWLWLADAATLTAVEAGFKLNGGLMDNGPEVEAAAITRRIESVMTPLVPLIIDQGLQPLSLTLLSPQELAPLATLVAERLARAPSSGNNVGGWVNLAVRAQDPQLLARLALLIRDGRISLPALPLHPFLEAAKSVWEAGDRAARLRLLAACAPGLAGEPGTVLTAALRDGDREVRCAALGRLGGSSGTPALRLLLAAARDAGKDDLAKRMRQTAMAALFTCNQVSDAALLREVVDDKGLDAQLRIWALGRLRTLDATTADSLATTLLDASGTDPDLRRQAMHLWLNGATEAAILSRCTAWSEAQRAEALAVLVQRAPLSSPAVIKAVTSCLTRCPPDQAGQLLAALSAQREPTGLALVVGQLGEAKLALAAHGALSQATGGCPQHGTGHLRDAREVQACIPLWRNWLEHSVTPPPTGAEAEALDRARRLLQGNAHDWFDPSEIPVPVLVRLLADRRCEDRAWKILAQHPSPEATPALAALLDDPSAARSRERIYSGLAARPAHPATATALAKRLTDQAGTAAAQVLLAWRWEPAAAELAESALAGRLNHPDEQRLVQWWPPAAAAAIRQVARAPGEATRQGRALGLLARKADPADVKLVADRFASNQPGNDDARALLAMCQAGSAPAGQALLRALAPVSRPAAKPPVRKGTKTEPPRVDEGAAQANRQRVLLATLEDQARQQSAPPALLRPALATLLTHEATAPETAAALIGVLAETGSVAEIDALAAVWKRLADEGQRSSLISRLTQVPATGAPWIEAALRLEPLPRPSLERLLAWQVAKLGLPAAEAERRRVSAQQAETAAREALFGQPVEGLVASCDGESWPWRPVVRPGTRDADTPPVNVVITLRNSGRKPLTFWSVIAEAHLANGAIPQLKGIQLSGKDGRAVEVTLAPGQSRTFPTTMIVGSRPWPTMLMERIRVELSVHRKDQEPLIVRSAWSPCAFVPELIQAVDQRHQH